MKKNKILEGYKYHLRDVVVVYILDKENNKVLLGERKKKGKPGLGKRVGIGGGIEPNESPEQAVYREVEEEISINKDEEVVFKLNKLTQMGIVYFIFPHKKDEPGWNQRCFVFTCDDFSGDPVETEVIKPEWYDIDKLPFEFMWEDNRYWLPQVLGGEKVEGVFVYDQSNSAIML